MITSFSEQVNRQILLDKLIRRGINEARDGRALQELSFDELASEWRFHWEQGG